MKSKLIFFFIIIIAMTISTTSLLADSMEGKGEVELPPPPTREIGDLSWMIGKSGFAAASEMLQEDERPFLVYFYNNACSEICAEFEELVLSDENLVSHIEQFTRIIVNVDQDERLGGRFGINDFPALLVMRISGSAQRVRLPEDEEGVLLYDPEYVIEKMRFSGLVSKV